MNITAPGIYDIDPAIYHADPCPEPSLSSSIARKLVRQSPMHAHYAHPKLGVAPYGAGTKAMNDGTLLHHILLGGGANIAVIEADDFRTKAAKEARDEAVAEGRTPVLAYRMDELHHTAREARKQIEAHPEGRILFEDGEAEQTIAWEEDGTWFRALADWLPADRTLPIFDIKTTGLSAAPGEWERRLVSEYAFQDAFYSRGFKAVTGRYPPPMRFVVVECEAPFGVSVMCAAPSLRAVAEAEVERAATMWRHCLRTNEWPGYPMFTAHIDAPPWMLARMEEQAMRDNFIQEQAT